MTAPRSDRSSLSLAIDASHHVDEVSRRVEDLEYLVVALEDALLDAGLAAAVVLIENERLLQLARDMVRLRGGTPRRGTGENDAVGSSFSG